MTVLQMKVVRLVPGVGSTRHRFGRSVIISFVTTAFDPLVLIRPSGGIVSFKSKLTGRSDQDSCVLWHPH